MLVSISLQHVDAIVVRAPPPCNPPSDRAIEETQVRGKGMGWRLYVDLVKQSGVAWVEDRAPTMGAALAFYSAFSLAPLLIIVIALAGAFVLNQRALD
jgi:membrane protein